MDILITYRHDIGGEIKYCVRSIQKYAKGIENIFIVGDNPKIEGTKHIPCKEANWGDNKCFATWHKVLNGCLNEDLSEDFILFADDYFLTKEIDFTDFKTKHRKFPLNYMADGKKIQPTETNAYLKLRHLAAKWLKSKGYSTVNYDLHCPMPMNKERVIELSKVFPYRKINISGIAPYALKSSYGNYFRVKGEEMQDNKINFENELEGNHRLKKGFMFSVGNFLMKEETKEFFEKMYPKKEIKKAKEKATVKHTSKKDYD